MGEARPTGTGAPARRPRRRVVEMWPARKNAAHNPFQALMAQALKDAGWEVREFSVLRSPLRRADVWSWHWPDGHFGAGGPVGARLRSAVLRLLLLRARLGGTRVVWTAHNLGNHEARNVTAEARFMRRFHRAVAGVHYLSSATRDEAVARFPALAERPHVVVPHGHYRSVLATVDRAAARERLDLPPDAPVLLFVGKVRAYKGVEDLLAAFRDVADPGAVLVVAGSAAAPDEETLRARAAADGRVRLLLRHLDDDELATVLGAADVVVLPYTRITNSGSALLALSAGRPVVAPALGALPELRELVGGGWVRLFAPPLAAHHLEEALVDARGRGGEPDLAALDWAPLGRDLADWYEELSRD